VDSGNVPGILAYIQKDVVGWCSIAPRREFPGLDRSPTLKPIDNADVWSITCFVIATKCKRHGIATALTKQAIAYAAAKGANIIEAYPILNADGKYRPVGESFMGFVSTIERLGFKQVSDRSKVRNIWRYYVE
jgi:hypothetical protein